MSSYTESTHQYLDDTSTQPFFGINNLYLHNINIDQTICDIIRCNYSSIHLPYKVKFHIECPAVLKLNILEIVFHSMSLCYLSLDYVPYKFCKTKSFVDNELI